MTITGVSKLISPYPCCHLGVFFYSKCLNEGQSLSLMDKSQLSNFFSRLVYVPWKQCYLKHNKTELKMEGNLGKAVQ